AARLTGAPLEFTRKKLGVSLGATKRQVVFRLRADRMQRHRSHHLAYHEALSKPYGSIPIVSKAK
ncbi:MAG: hypothetical protein RSB04_11705, partial [Gordonibacter sp.]|uniref:hypothetical protein n=1 Tax=Gordonibacter sp. TaxID=1968902 RepID=UPI002FCB2146